MQTHALRIRLHHCFYPMNCLFQFAKSIERQCLCLPQKHRLTFLKNTERFTSKAPNDLPQKHRLICIKKQDFLADFINLLYLCWRIKKRFH